MSCAVANSPVFSPSRASLFSPSRASLFCKTSVSAPESLTLTSPCGSLPSSSPFRLRIQKPSPIGFRTFNNKKDIFCGVSGLNSDSSSSSSAALKRKRQIKIDIPVASLSFGATETPRVAGESVIEVEREGYSVYSKKGRRAALEDRFSAVDDLQGDNKQAGKLQSFFGVFDGHGGAKAAEFSAEHLHKNIAKEATKGTEILDAIKHGYLTTDSEFLKEDVRGGSCCVSALISDGDLYVSNVGDCRAVMSRGGAAEALTSDHRLSREDERSRIEARGGYVEFRHGAWRLLGSLAVSRAMGDQHLKQWVVAEPETKVVTITSDCEFLVLASDGLWDKVSNQEAVDLARPYFVDSDKASLATACKRLAELAAMRGSVDDTSVMIIRLKNFTSSD